MDVANSRIQRLLQRNSSPLPFLKQLQFTGRCLLCLFLSTQSQGKVPDHIESVDCFYFVFFSALITPTSRRHLKLREMTVPLSGILLLHFPRSTWTKWWTTRRRRNKRFESTSRTNCPTAEMQANEITWFLQRITIRRTTKVKVAHVAIGVRWITSVGQQVTTLQPGSSSHVTFQLIAFCLLRHGGCAKADPSLIGQLQGHQIRNSWVRDWPADPRTVHLPRPWKWGGTLAVDCAPFTDPEPRPSRSLVLRL